MSNKGDFNSYVNQLDRHNWEETPPKGQGPFPDGLSCSHLTSMLPPSLLLTIVIVIVIVIPIIIISIIIGISGRINLLATETRMPENSRNVATPI